MTFLSKYLCFGFFLFVMEDAVSISRGCDRHRSRLVRKVVKEKLMPAYTALNTELSDECVFSVTNDRYHTQESHKSVEDGNRWNCHFCGKAFMTEYFLDLHFENRHADQLLEGKSVCLADTCEVFRCDVIGSEISADFWDIALCLEDDMKSLHHKCSLMVKSCVPSGLTKNETEWLTNITMQNLCSYLTCSKYWDMPFELNTMDGTVGLYIVMTVMILFAVIIYYSLFYAYFYTDAFLDAVVYDPTPLTKHRIKPYPSVRHRPRAFAGSHAD